MKRVTNPKVFATAFFSTWFFIGMIACFVMGGLYFGKDYPKVLNYENSMCQVDKINIKTDSCHTRYSTYTCYGPTWDVYYGANRTIHAKVESEARYQSSLEALYEANDYLIGTSYPCWYDTKNPSVAQWDKPSALLGIILLSFAGLLTLLFMMFVFLTKRFFQQDKLQKEHDMLN